MKNKENILEDISRIHLLMNYDSNKTLNENLNVIPKITLNETVVINEQSGRRFEALFKKFFNKLAANEFDSVFQAIRMNSAVIEKGVKFTDGTIVQNGADFMNRVRKNVQLSEDGLRNLRRGILGSSNPKLKNFQFEIIDTMLSEPSVLENLAKGVKDEKIYESIFDRFIKAGYSDDVSEKLAADATRKIKGNSNLENLVPKRVDGGTPPPPNPHPVPVPPPKPTLWQRIKKYGLYALAGVGGLSLLYYFLYSGSDSGIKLPFCLKKKATEDEVEESKQNDFKNINIATTGNAEIDAMGGATFDIDSNDVTFGDGSTGTWQIVGKNLNIYTNGQTYSIECRQSETPPPPPPPPVEDKKYKNCTDFPYVKYCKSEQIREIQECLGITADSAYGPKTERALREAGYDTTITKEVYDEIMAECLKNNKPVDIEPEKDIVQGDYLRPDNI